MFRPSRTLPFRALLLAVGSAIAAYGYLVTAGAQLGNGPLFAVQDGLHHQLGWSLGWCATVTGLVVVSVAAALRAPIGPGTVALPFLTGWWVSRFQDHVIAADGLTARWALFLAATAVMMLGGVLVFSAAFGASAMDGVMLGLAARLRREPPHVRLAMEVSLAIGGALLGGRVGLGTVVMGATVGHFFAFWRGRLVALRGAVQDRPRWAGAAAFAVGR